MLSIIIPTLDEEKNLGSLLPAIKSQVFGDYEIIVADAGSKDKTLIVAKKNNCLIIKGGLPARGKNQGAKAAKGDLLLFLDADIRLPEDFFKKGLEEFKKKNLGIATFCLLPLKEDKFLHLLFDIFYNFPIIFLEKVLPHAATGIMIKKEIFDKLSGFDEEIKLAEDHNLARRANKIAKYGVLRSVRISISERRFEKDGWLKTSLKYFLCQMHMIFIGPVKSDVFNIFEYKYNHYLKNNKKYSKVKSNKN